MQLFEGHKVYFNNKGYPLIWIDGKDKAIHILVWEREYGEKPKKYEIHHKDLDKTNFSLGNLELLSSSDHHKVHAGWIKTNEEWSHKPCNGCNKILPLSDFYERKTTPSALCKSCHIIDTNNRMLSSIENKEKTKIYKRNYYMRSKLKESKIY